MSLSQNPAFLALLQHHRHLQQQNLTLNRLFDDPSRFDRFSLSAAGLFLDYSKNFLTEKTVGLLCELAVQRDVARQRDAMFQGDKINFTEQRAVLHTALRAPANRPLYVDGVDINADVHAVLAQMQTFVEQVHSGTWRGASGLPISDVVNIGIGGSDLGPKMACEALRCYARPKLRSHFLSNVDGHALDAVFNQLNPATTLFIISSKTFTTRETMLNAHAARRWFLTQFSEDDLSKHFVAVSTNHEACKAFGIAPGNQFRFWDWVGGRYSLWSAMGLSIALATGFEHFRALLDGAYAMDQHFQQAPIEQNMPVLMALIGIWNRNVLGLGTLSLAPYHQDLKSFPAYLQQLDMESNGKHIDHYGQAVDVSTGPVIWGDVGTNAQHAYFQHLHQSTDVTPVDFIAVLKPQHVLAEHHRVLLANCFAQSQALMRGKSAEQVASEMQAQGWSHADIKRLAHHRTFTGNRPSNTLLLDELNPTTLGALIALYEHKVAIQGFIWGINSFDQWGVELGKVLATGIEAELSSSLNGHQNDSSTAGLVARAVVSLKSSKTLAN